jgi:hypothetical protein
LRYIGDGVAHRLRGADQPPEAPPRLDRCRCKGTDGTKRWVGLGFADNLINLAQALDASSAF